MTSYNQTKYPYLKLSKGQEKTTIHYIAYGLIKLILGNLF